MVVSESGQHSLELISTPVRAAVCPVIALLDVDDPAFIHEAAKRGVFAYITNGDATDDQFGFKIYSVELEYTLLSHPAIGEAAVVGVPDPLTFEQVAAFIVLRPGHNVSRREIRRHVAERMADYAVPHQIRIVDELPRNRKVVKADLRDQLTCEHRAASP